MEALEVAPHVRIPLDELEWTASRGGGPGGQHVNKVSTRVAVVFDVSGSPSLAEATKERIRDRLGHRLTRDGRLRIACGVHRSQAANRREVLERLRALLEDALRPRRRRVATGVPGGEREKRLTAKRARAKTKRDRAMRSEDE
jgi:ribosome-associated protein